MKLNGPVKSGYQLLLMNFDDCTGMILHESSEVLSNLRVPNLREACKLMGLIDF